MIKLLKYFILGFFWEFFSFNYMKTVVFIVSFCLKHPQASAPGDQCQDEVFISGQQNYSSATLSLKDVPPDSMKKTAVQVIICVTPWIQHYLLLLIRMCFLLVVETYVGIAVGNRVSFKCNTQASKLGKWNSVLFLEDKTIDYMREDSSYFSSVGALKEEICSQTRTCKWNLEYGRWFQESNMKLINPFKEQTWNLLWWNCDDKPELVEDTLYSSLSTLSGGGSYYHETKRILLNYYDAEVDFVLIPSVISVAFLQTVGIGNLHSCVYILLIQTLPLAVQQKKVFLSYFKFSEKAMENCVN